MKKTFTIALLSIFLSAGFATSVHALTISPARLEIAGDPGQVVSGEFELVNEQEDTKTFYTSTANFEAQGESGTPSFIPGREGLASWILVAPQVVLAKGQKAKVPFTITLPRDADAGGHFAAIFLSTQPNNAAGGQVAVGAKIGMLVLMRVSGDIVEGGGITGFSTKDNRFFHTSLPVTFAYKFNNTGNDRVNPYGEVRIVNTLQLTTKKIPANESQGNVLPGSTRRFDVLWGTPRGDNAKTDFFSMIGYEATHFAFGFYTAKLDLHYGNSGVAHGSKTIFVFPWQLMIVVVSVGGLLFLVLTRGLKRYNRWIIAKARRAN